MLGSSGCQRGRRPSVWEGVQRKPFQGFPLGNFFLTAYAVLLCAAKKNSDSRWRLCRLTDMGCRAGVGTTRLAGFCQFSPDPWVTHSSKKTCRWKRQIKNTLYPTTLSRGRKLAVPPLVDCFSQSRPYRVPIGILRDNGRDRHTPNRNLSGGSSGMYSRAASISSHQPETLLGRKAGYFFPSSLCPYNGSIIPDLTRFVNQDSPNNAVRCPSTTS